MKIRSEYQSTYKGTLIRAQKNWKSRKIVGVQGKSFGHHSTLPIYSTVSQKTKMATS